MSVIVGAGVVVVIVVLVVVVVVVVRRGAGTTRHARALHGLPFLVPGRSPGLSTFCPVQTHFDLTMLARDLSELGVQM